MYGSTDELIRGRILGAFLVLLDFAVSPIYLKSAWQLPLQQTESKDTISSP